MLNKNQLLSDALHLSPTERAEVAHELLLSLENDRDADSESEWAQVIQRRAEEVLNGTAKQVDARDAARALSERLRNKR